jgi:outer membrane protein assembly factor BamB
LLWSFRTGNVVYSAPAVVSGVVYFGSANGILYALNAATGAQIWECHGCGSGLSSPTVVNGVVYSASDRVYAVDAATGKVRWSFKPRKAYFNASPTVVNGVVYAGTVYSDGRLYALKANNGALLWTFRPWNEDLTTVAVADGMVYVGSVDWNLYAVDARTGTMKWKFTTASNVFMIIYLT